MHDAQSKLVSPYGGRLAQLLVSQERAAQIKAESVAWKSWDLTPAQLGTLELLLSGALSPLSRFMLRDEYKAVLEHLRLPCGTSWPVPIVLEVDPAFASSLELGDSIALRDPEGVMLVALQVEDVWKADSELEAVALGGEAGLARIPPVDRFHVGGRVECLQFPVHHDFRSLRLTPAALREWLETAGWTNVAVFQPSGIFHRATVEATRAAASEVGARLLVHVPVHPSGATEPDHYMRVRCCRAAVDAYPENFARLALFPFASTSSGSRDLMLRAIIARNSGCSHLILEGEPQGSLQTDPGASVTDEPGVQRSGDDVGGSNRLAAFIQDELGVTVLRKPTFTYSEQLGSFVPVEAGSADGHAAEVRDNEIEDRLARGMDVPGWFTPPAIVEELRRRYRPRHVQGLTIFFTGLPSAGKSTVANVLLVRFLEEGRRSVTLLDGDIVRKHLSSELGFSREHRDLNITRIGFVAAEITRNGGIAICAPIAPYDATRKEVRRMAEAAGGFVLVHVSTPLEVCETRDRKGMYAKARAGVVKQFTGISDPYEVPGDAEITIDTSEGEPEEAADAVVRYLTAEGYLLEPLPGTARKEPF
jgi:sulfate adenylyltransferase